MKVWIYGALAAMLVSGAADATLITISFGGGASQQEIAGTDNLFTGSLVYDTSVAAYQVTESTNYSDKLYHALQSFTLSSGSFTTSQSFLANDEITEVSYSDYPSTAINTFAAQGDSTGGYHFSFVLQAQAVTGAITSSDLPNYLDISKFAGRNVDVTDTNGKHYTGTVTSMSFSSSAPVPEPATWAMMIGGFGMIGASLRQRRGSLTQSAITVLRPIPAWQTRTSGLHITINRKAECAEASANYFRSAPAAA